MFSTTTEYSGVKYVMRKTVPIYKLSFTTRNGLLPTTQELRGKGLAPTTSLFLPAATYTLLILGRETLNRKAQPIQGTTPGTAGTSALVCGKRRVTDCHTGFELRKP